MYTPPYPPSSQFVESLLFTYLHLPSPVDSSVVKIMFCFVLVSSVVSERQLILTTRSRFTVSLPKYTFSDIKLVAWGTHHSNKYLYQRNVQILKNVSLLRNLLTQYWIYMFSLGCRDSRSPKQDDKTHTHPFISVNSGIVIIQTGWKKWWES